MKSKRMEWTSHLTGKEPLVSVIVPAFNVEGYIGQTIGSILAQSYSHLEVIVVDDGSTDGTSLVVADQSMRDSRIRFMSNLRSRGAAGARNTGILAARGDWITFLDADDLWAPGAIEERLKAAEMFPEAEFISGDVITFKDGSIPSGLPRSYENMFWRSHLSASHITGTPLLIENPVRLFVQSCLTWTGCVMVSADLLSRGGMFDERFRQSEDDHLWLRLSACTTSFLFVPSSVASYRIRPGSLTNSGRALFYDAVLAYEDLMGRPEFKPYKRVLSSQVASFAEQNTFYYRKRGQRMQALRWSLHTLYLSPFNLLHWKNLAAALLFR